MQIRLRQWRDLDGDRLRRKGCRQHASITLARFDLRGVAVAATTPTAATRTGGGQLLAGFLQHSFRIVTGSHHPHHEVVSHGGLVKQESWIETQPAVHQLLLGLHRHGHQFRLRPAAGGFESWCCLSGFAVLSGQREVISLADGLQIRTATAPTTATTAAAPATATGFRARWTEHLSAG